MIETSLAFTADSQKNDAAYADWRGSMAATRQRQGGSMRYDINDRTAGPMPSFGAMMDKSSYGTGVFDHGNALSAGNTNAVRADIAYQTATPDDAFSFGDVIDIINPLQHLPVIGTLYRKFTGDTMKGFSEIIGGAIFGGPVGAVSSTVNVVIKESTGKDMAENVFSLVGINASPKVEEPRLTYLAPVEPENLEGTTLAVANLSLARDGRQNFAAKSIPVNRWNA